MEENENVPVELTELFHDEIKSLPLSEIIVFQAVICVVVSIIFVLLNMLYPEIAAEVYDETFGHFNKNIRLSELIDGIAEWFNTFLSGILK